MTIQKGDIIIIIDGYKEDKYLVSSYEPSFNDECAKISLTPLEDGHKHLIIKNAKSIN